MTDWTPLLLALWSEVGRHQDAAEALPVFVQALSDALPLAALHIAEYDAGQDDFTTLLDWTAAGGLRLRPHTPACGAAPAGAIRAWAQRQRIASRPPAGDWETPLRLFEGSAALAGPLWLADALIGVAAIALRGREPPTDATRECFAAVLEPLAAAVANDHRLRELHRLNASAEADRETLLARLGRHSLAETVVGADQGLRLVMARVAQVAGTDATVLILGETGAGKEVIARAIHERSRRHAGPFIRVNCGAVPPELIDSELFGHEKGSFTGALASRRGWFERADGGTLFLDEIGELTPQVQVRLLRVLQDGIVQRLGSERELSVDVRVIAATHRDLPTLVQDGAFREDLWYRLAVFPLILPPLRERPEDIPLLAAHFVQRAAGRLGVPTPRLTARDLDRLLAYRWPGNVRELGAVLERAVILGGGARLDLETALGAGIARKPRTPAAPAHPGILPSGTPAAAIAPLDQVISAHLEQALRATGGRVDGPHGAARLLGVNPSTLRAKLRKHGIDAAGHR
ncbi:MAG: sigma-54-dependent Fis family transcriptional regulator [Porticoccaceae bacterium]